MSLSALVRYSRRLIPLLIALLLPAVVVMTRAQELQCADAIKRILQDTGDRCKDTLRNKGCYGNDLVLATPREGVPLDGANAFVFQKPSDQANITDIDTLRLAPLKQDANQWGVSYLRVQANFPDVQAGQFVTMLLFGDASIEDRSKQTSTATGKQQSPLQAVYFRTGAGSPSCKSAPTSGLILQTPRGAQKAELTINEVKLRVGSTIFLQSPSDELPTFDPNAPTPTATSSKPTLPPTNTPRLGSTLDPNKHKLVLTVIEGSVEVTIGNRTLTVRTGEMLEIPLTEDNSRPLGFLFPVKTADVQPIVDVFIKDSVLQALLVPTPTPIPTNTPRIVAQGPGQVASATAPPTPTPYPTPIPTNAPPANTALPTNVTVTSTADNGPGSLRQALADVAPGGVVNFALASEPMAMLEQDYTVLRRDEGASSISLFSEITIAKDVTINGPGVNSVTLYPDDARAFNITGGNVTINNLGIAYGFAGDRGGCINVAGGSLTLNQVEVRGCSAEVAGAGMYIAAGASATLRNTHISGNVGALGAVGVAGTLNAANTTIDNNYATGIEGPGSVTLVNVTIGENNGDGIYLVSGGGSITNSTIVNNGASGVTTTTGTRIVNSIFAGNGTVDLSGAFTSIGHNLVQNKGTSVGLVGSDILGFPAQIDVLINLGGAVPTYALFPSSLALSAADPAYCPSADARGITRPQPPPATACDIGSFESPFSTPIVVTSLADSGPGSLRQIITSAPASSTITFGVTGTITLGSEIVIDKPLIIQGPGPSALTISGGGTTRIFRHTTNDTVTINNVTLANGNAGGGRGGAIDNEAGNLSLTRIIVRNNTTTDNGGGVINWLGGGTVDINLSTFSGNSAAYGGALFNYGGAMTVTNSTFTGNSGSVFGGALQSWTNTTLTQVTIAGNSASGSAGGIHNSGGTITLTRSIIGNNTAPTCPDLQILGTLSEGGNNLIQNAGGCGVAIFSSTDVNGVDPQVSALANNGGFTDTMAIDYTSPAVDAGGICSGIDQRGIDRPQGAACDIGAFEYEVLYAARAALPPATSTPAPTLTSTIAPTATASASPTSTSTATNIAAPTNTATHTSTATNTIAPTNTSTATNTVAPTRTYTPTASSTVAPTRTYTPTPTNTPISTLTFTSTPTATP